MVDPIPHSSRAEPSLCDATLPPKPLSERAQFIVDNPSRFEGLLTWLHWFEPHVRYISDLRAQGLLEEADRWQARYARVCAGVMPEDRFMVMEALKSHLAQKANS